MAETMGEHSRVAASAAEGEMPTDGTGEFDTALIRLS
jgi:hypothetical protein